ncbi:MAG: YkgJ family cysteine cluster protein [Bacillota bacterium]
MIEPSKVKEAFQKVENENYSFRVYLKNHADVDELDEQFLELHNELFSSYDCSKCRNCCKAYSASFEEDEIEPVATFLKMTEKDFIDQHIETTVDGYEINIKPCCFLGADGECQIEACKPASCKDYPFTDKPERLFSLYSILDSAMICPVVFEMFERLKKIYRFKRRKRY